jgi:hypothetical protein
MEQQLQQLQDRLDRLESLYFKDNFEGRQTFRKDIVLTKKVGFNGVEPINVQSAITYPSAGATIDVQCRAATSSILDLLRNYGLTL